MNKTLRSELLKWQEKLEKLKLYEMTEQVNQAIDDAIQLLQGDV